MNLNELRHVYFIGIGGIGMSALARYFLQQGVKVSGYDKTKTKLTKLLMEEGITINYEDDISLVPTNIDLVVYTPAIPANLKQFSYLKEKKTALLKRAELLGEISKDKFTIAIAGTHGKTTITSLVAHIFNTAGVKMAAFIGGILKNYESNYIGNSNPDVVIVEADEFDRSFLNLKANIGLISSVDADHLDIYQTKSHLIDSFMIFMNQSGIDAKWLVNKNIERQISSGSQLTYNLNESANFCIGKMEIKDAAYHFSIQTAKNEIDNLQFFIPGRHNLENVVGAVSIANIYGIEDDIIRKALSTYRGVDRRFDIVVNRSNCVFIDDYAHHPEELKACINAVREFYPKKKLTGIFQPHLYSRTRDFADEFARSLELLDELILLEIYPAREKPIAGINSELLLNKINVKNKYLLSKNEVLEFIKEQNPELIITLGAGDIDQLVQPIKEILIDEKNV